MIYLSVALSLLWVATLIHAQRHHKNKYKWQDTAISKYITHDRTLQIGFISLSFALVAAGLHFGGIPLWLFSLSGVGAWGVMMTMDNINGKPHVFAAITTYVAALAACALAADNGVLLGLAIGNILYSFFAVLIQDEIGDAERYISLGLISWLGLASFLL